MISSRLSKLQAYRNRVHHAVAAARTGPASEKPHRLLISGPPRKIVYPVCPDTEARGKVSLQAVVDFEGGVSHVKVLAGDRVLAAAAIAAVRQWRYQPFSDAAPAEERETNITVSFISSEVVAVSFPDAVPISR
jgi:outer membrane biosynthesis protein TonB